MAISDIPSLPGPSLIGKPERPPEAKPREEATRVPPGERMEKCDEEKERTFLFYVNGNNWMHKMAPGIMRQLEMVGSDKNINLVAQVSRSKHWYDKIVGDWCGARRYKAEQDTEGSGVWQTIKKTIKNTIFAGIPPFTKGIKSPVVEDLGKVDMGDSDTLVDFIKWGMKKYPAKRYCVVMVGPSQGFYRMMKDEETGSSMASWDLQDAFAQVHKDMGKKIDVLTIDASSGASTELAYQLKDHVDYLVGSEGVLAGDGLPLPATLYEVQRAQEYKKLDPKELAQTFTMVGSMSPYSPYFSPTVSAVELDKMEKVKSALDEFAKTLLEKKVDVGYLRELIDLTQELSMSGTTPTKSYEGVKDPYHFAEMVYKDKKINSPEVKKAAKQVMLAIDDAVVGEAFTTGAFKDTHGLSIFLPKDYGFIRPDTFPVPEDHCRKFEYEMTDFGMNSDWTKLLEKIAKEPILDRAARKIGFSEDALDAVHGMEKAVEPTVEQVSGIASTIGWWESYNVFSGGKPTPILGIPAVPCAVAGAYGGAWDTYKAVNRAVVSGHKYKNWDGVIMHSMDAVGGICKSAANLSLLVQPLAPYGQIAGLVGFLKPWIKDLYGLWADYKAMRDSIVMKDAPKAEKIADIVKVHYKKGIVWDK